MCNIIFYSTGKIFGEKQTGGIKRFEELLKYYVKEQIPVSLFSCDDSIRIIDEKSFYHLDDNVRDTCVKCFPEELKIFIRNFRILKKIENSDYKRIVVFDIPPAFGLSLLNLHDIVLLIRKDVIEYEKVINKSNYIIKRVKLFFLWLCELICMLRVKKVIVQCNYDLDKIIKRHPLLKSQILKKSAVQINNVNPSWIINNSISINESGLREIGNKNDFKVCFVGSFNDSRKGASLFLPVAMELANDANYKFVVVGGGKELEAFKNLYKHSNITFTGYVSNPLVYMKDCQLIVVPSFADSCPNTVMEALYNNIPVVGSKAGGIPEILVDNQALFELNHNSLKQLITFYSKHREELCSLWNRQKKRSYELTFNWAEKIHNLIQ